MTVHVGGGVGRRTGWSGPIVRSRTPECAGRAVRLLAAVIMTVSFLGIAGGPASGRQATPDADGVWESRMPIPLARSELAAAAIGSAIYVAGGFGGGERLDRFDTKTGTWEQLADLPEAVHHAGVAALDGLIYVVGGYRIEGMTEVAAVHAYDPATGVWSPRADLPTPRGALGLAAFDGYLYAVGGARDHLGGPVSDAVERYDPARNVWESLEPLPTPREHLAVAATDEAIFAIGGRANGDESDRFAAANERYDPATDAWSLAAPLPVPRGGLSGVFVDGSVVVLGGERGSTTHNDANLYDPVSDRWRALPPLPTPRHGLATAAIAGTIYAITGSTRAGGIENTPVVEALRIGRHGRSPPTSEIAA